MQNSAGIVDFPPSHACMLEVSQIHNSPTPTHHPAKLLVNSKNPKYPPGEEAQSCLYFRPLRPRASYPQARAHMLEI